MERFTKFFTSLGGVLTSLAAVIGGVVALYLAFGGGDNSSSSNGPPPPAVVGTTSNAALEDWRTEAEDVCRNATRQAKALGPNPTDQPGQVERVRQLIPIMEGFTNEVRALDEPSEIQDDVARMIDKMDQTAELAQSMVNSYQIGDVDSANRARLELQGVSTDADRAMADLGLKKCVAFS
jgi:hypothetical protein